MTTTTEVLDARGDATLIAAIRDGDTDAYGVLFARHVDAARRLARGIAPHGDADDLVSEAFAKVLPVLVRGGGPDLAFRPYLLAAVRRLNVDRHRALTRTRPTDDESVLDEGEAFTDTAVAGFESTAAARAFASLPERWQAVLWHTEVEGQRPADVAPLLGLTPNGVSALAHRAREGLRQAFVSMHVQDTIPGEPACQATRANLGAYIRGGLSNREATRVSAHLEGCRPCTAIYLELLEVDNDLRGILAPLLLGGAAAAYLSDVPAAVGSSLAGAVGGFLKTGPGKALAGTAAASVVVGGLVLGGELLLGGTERSGPEQGAIAAPSARTAERAGTGGGTAKPARPVKPKPTPEPTAVSQADSTNPGTTTDAQPDQTQPTHTEQQPDPSGDGHGDGHGNGGGDGNGGGGQSGDHPDPNKVDLSVTANSSGAGPSAMVTVQVTGLSPTQTGLVTITADQLAATVNLDPRCDLVGVSRATCRIAGRGSLQLFAAGVPLTSTTLTITATPGEGLHDSSTGDNTARIQLDGRV